MVKAPANTGIDRANSHAVTKIDQVYKSSVDQYLYGSMPMKLIALDRDETPATCMASIIMSCQPLIRDDLSNLTTAHRAFNRRRNSSAYGTKYLHGINYQWSISDS